MGLENDHSRFQTTLWSVVLHAGGGDGSQQQAALDRLCRAYWKPLFVYCLGTRRKMEDAVDMTQAFFEWMMARDTLRVADQASRSAFPPPPNEPLTHSPPASLPFQWIIQAVRS